MGITGKAVQIRCGPATVSGDESRNTHCLIGTGGKRRSVERYTSQETCPDDEIMCAFVVKADCIFRHLMPRLESFRVGFFSGGSQWGSNRLSLIHYN